MTVFEPSSTSQENFGSNVPPNRTNPATQIHLILYMYISKFSQPGESQEYVTVAESERSSGIISETAVAGSLLGSNTAFTSDVHNFTTCISSSYALLA